MKKRVKSREKPTVVWMRGDQLKGKTKEQLAKELDTLRKQVAELKEGKANRERAGGTEFRIKFKETGGV
ncbi:MAG: hypothetical protein V3V63_01810 [Candidatus Hydrothermarchaeaceae archaeon]